MAGKSILTALRRLTDRKHTNWVENLPRVIRAYHNTPKESGLSPFQVVFGRDRYEAGAPYETLHECEGAKQFFDRMEELDRQVAEPSINFMRKHKIN